MYSSQNLIKNKQNSFTGPLSYQDLRESASGPQSDREGQEGGGGGRGIGTCKSFTWEVPYPQVKFLPLVYTGFDGKCFSIKLYIPKP